MSGRREAHRPDPSRPLGWTLGLVLVFMVAEVVGGLVSGSLALLADAGHMLSDAASLALALFAARIARRPPTPRRTYGSHRAEILAALANGITLGVVSLWVLAEAWGRFRDPPDVAGPLMLTVAAGGLAVNLVALRLLEGGRHHDLNVRGAWLHVVGDTAGSVGAIVAGLLILWRGWTLADPVASVLIAVLVLWSGWRLVREAVDVLMEGTPAHVDLAAVDAALQGIPGVREVHDLHVWTISSGLLALSAHAVLDGTRSGGEVLEAMARRMDEGYGIRHTTIQIEPTDFEDPRRPI